MAVDQVNLHRAMAAWAVISNRFISDNLSLALDPESADSGPAVIVEMTTKRYILALLSPGHGKNRVIRD